MTATFYVGDAIEGMNKLPANSVDLILTSPPFLALRSYLPQNHPDKALEGGSQSTPGEFIDWLLDVVEACNRVLAPHGSLCIELGDTYAGGGTGLANYSDDRGNPDGMRDTTFSGGNTKTGGGTGWPLAKSLSLIPESFRFAMVYGFNPHTGRTTEPWRLRNVIRWVRPNPPVGALGDKFRPATSELMVFCKSAKRYFDLDAVREPLKYDYKPYDRAPDSKAASRAGKVGEGPRMDRAEYNPAGAPPLDWWNIPLLEGEEETRYGPGEKPKAHARTAKGVESVPRVGKSAERGGNWASLPELHETLGAPPLDWWNIPPGGYEGAHYAVFPPELCVKPVKAMCPEKVCRVCGEPSRRIVEADAMYRQTTYLGRGFHDHSEDATEGRTQKRDSGHVTAIYNTVGWTDCGHSCKQCEGLGSFEEQYEGASFTRTCRACDGVSNYRPGVVLDPFAGSGTTLAVATGHGRDAIGIDLDSRNFDLALERVGPFILTRGDQVGEPR